MMKVRECLCIVPSCPLFYFCQASTSHSPPLVLCCQHTVLMSKYPFPRHKFCIWDGLSLTTTSWSVILLSIKHVGLHIFRSGFKINYQDHFLESWVRCGHKRKQDGPASSFCPDFSSTSNLDCLYSFLSEWSRWKIAWSVSPGNSWGQTAIQCKRWEVKYSNK